MPPESCPELVRASRIYAFFLVLISHRFRPASIYAARVVLGEQVKLTRTRRMPYCIRVHWFEVVLFSSSILLLSAIAIGGFREGRPGSQFRTGLAGRHTVFLWLDLVFLLLVLFVFVRDIFRVVVFSETEVEYRFFWVHRRFYYHDLQSIRPVSSYNRTARFTFRDGSEFKFPLAYYDADYLLEILKARSPNILEELAALRDSLTPHRLRVAR